MQIGAAKARYIGNMLEYTTAKNLVQRGAKPIDAYSEQKYNKWDASYTDQLCETARMPHSFQFDSVFSDLKIDFTKPTKFQLAKDSPNDSTDIYVYSNDTKTPISLKNRNNKIKHQRPKALYKQLALTPLQTTKFQKAYNEINDRYYDKWKQHALFNELGIKEKQKLYDEVMDLTIKYLSKRNHMLTYMRFLMESTNNNTLCWYPEKERFIMIPSKASTFSTFSIHRETTFIYITTDQIKLKIRIHNASSRITPKLQLKYDTSIG